MTSLIEPCYEDWHPSQHDTRLHQCHDTQAPSPTNHTLPCVNINIIIMVRSKYRSHSDILILITLPTSAWHTQYRTGLPLTWWSQPDPAWNDQMRVSQARQTRSWCHYTLSRKNYETIIKNCVDLYKLLIDVIRRHWQTFSTTSSSLEDPPDIRPLYRTLYLMFGRLKEAFTITASLSFSSRCILCWTLSVQLAWKNVKTESKNYGV